MGASFTNLQIRNATTPAICAVLTKLAQGRAYVSPENRGWVTVYPEATEDQSEIMRDIASGLSRTFKTDVLGFLVYDSDIAVYWLYRDGTLRDEFNSAPDYFGERADEKTRARVRGNPDVLLPLCISGTTLVQLDQVLHPADGFPIMAEEILTDLAKLLGIDETRASLGFNYFEEEGEELLSDVAGFEPIGEGAERKEARLADLDAPGTPFPDTYPIAINMLTQTWDNKYGKEFQAFSGMFGKDMDAILKQVRDGFDKSARDLLKKSTLPNLPTIEELKTARDQGPEALALLVAEKTSGQLTEIGIGAAVCGQEAFLTALFKRGLDPNAANAYGRTTLNAAEQHGTRSAIYRLAKAATEGK